MCFFILVFYCYQEMTLSLINMSSNVRLKLISVINFGEG